MVRVRVLSIILAAVSIIYADVEVKTEQLNPADPTWNFKTIVAPSKSDIALDADFSVVENKLATVGARTDKLSDGELSMKADDLSTVVFLSNDSSDKGKILIDLGKVQKVSAFCTYSWHEHAPDHGARGPQVYTLYGSENNADHTDLAKWTKIADVDTRPNTTGEKWNGQHGAVVSDTKGRLGDYRYLLMVVSPTASPKQANTQWTHTFFTEIDVHTEETLAKAGDFEIFKPAKVLIIGDSISIGYTPYVAEILKGKAVVTHNKGNAGPTMRGIANIDKWLGSNKWDVIHFNWGLWDMYGWQYLNIDRSPKAYEARLEKLVLRLKKTDAKLIWATTTPICPKANVYRNKVFFVEPKVEKEYLDAAARVMKKHNIQVNDLHSFIKAKRSEYARADNDVHYNVKGQKKLAEQVASAIEKSIDNVDGKSPSSALKSDAEARQETSTIKLLSSSGDVAFEISAQDGKLTYAVKRNRAAVIEKSDLGIIIDDDTYGTKTTIPGSTRGRINERYPWRGVKSEVLNKCNTMLIKLDDDGRKWQVEARAYDDGIAFRYIIPGTGSRKVKGELTSWHMPVDTMAWCSDSTVYYQGEFTRQRVDQIVCKKSNKLCMPLTFELADGTYAAISEADVMGYSGMTVRPDGTYTLKAIFEDNLNGWNMTDLIETPWRVVMTGPDLNALVNCDLIHNVCPPPDPKLFPEGMRTEWVQAGTGRSFWQWWAYLNPGTHWSLQKKFVDQAARLNCDFYLVDEGWEHPRQEWFEPGVTDSWPRLKELCEYGQSRGVGILVWRAWHASKNAWFPGLETEAKRESFFCKCAEVGVKGVKIDFMDSESHDRLEFYLDCLRKGAKYKITVNFHGANKPVGESRTWPNEVSREAIRGLEQNIHNTCTPELYSTLPFTRLLAGHGDFTHTTFQAARLKGTTPGMQMATPVLLTSAVQHWADKGEVYLNSPAVNMIRSMPTVWDETRVLPGSKIAEVAKLARRNGKVWYLAVANSKADLDHEIKLDFLGKGKYLADVVRDDPAERSGMIAEEITVSAKDTFSCKLLRGGGLCIRFSKVRMKPFGDTFYDTLDVSIDRAGKCDIRYTLDGSEPTSKSAKLVGDSLTIEERCRLRLKVIKGDGKGTLLEADFIKVPLAAPVVESGAIIWEDSKVKLAIADDAPAASIFYTTDGSLPDESSIRYAGPFEVKKDCVLKAVAVKGSVKSPVAEHTLTCQPKPDVELSSLTADSMTTGWGEVGINKSCQGNELRIGGRKFESGVGVHANSALLYSLKNEYKRFVAIVGVDDEIIVNNRSTVKFLVKIDGKQVASSPLMKINDIYAFNVAIPENAQKIELISTDGGDGNHSDHADWCNVGFLK